MADDFFTQQTRRATRGEERRHTARRRRLIALVVAFVVVAAGAVAALVITAGGGAPQRAAEAGPAVVASAPASSGAMSQATASASPAAGATAGADASSGSDVGAAPDLTPTPAPLRRPTKKDPLRVYFGGDSLSGMPGVMFAQRAQRTGLMKVTVDYQTSSRLTVPDPVDWPARLRAQLGSRRYDAAAFMIGINDTGMPMIAGGSSTMYPSKAWLREYQDRVEKLARVMLQAGAERVYWVGLPVMPKHGQTAAVEDLNEIFEEAAARHPDVVYVDTFPVLATKSGDFDPSVRSGDGVHFTNEGATLLGDAVWTAMQKDWRTSPAGSSDAAD